jgi:hypothetical protein
MIRSFLARLFGGTDGGGAEQAGTQESGNEGTEQEQAADQDGEDDDGGFLRSRLDASVLHSHGMGGQTAEVDEPRVSEEEAEALDQYHDEQ